MRKPKSIFDIDASLTPPTIGRLDTAEGVRKEMIRVYKDARTGRTSTANGSRLVFMLTCIAKCGEAAQLESRLDEVEARLACLDVQEVTPSE